jgi:hypothetical protein
LEVLDAEGKEQTIDLRVMRSDGKFNCFSFFDPLAEKVEFWKLVFTRLRNYKNLVSVISSYIIGKRKILGRKKYVARAGFVLSDEKLSTSTALMPMTTDSATHP